MYVFGADILVAYLQGNLPRGIEGFRDTDPRLVKVPAPAKAELLLAAAAADDPERARGAADALLVNFEVIPFDERCADNYARICAALGSAAAPGPLAEPLAPGDAPVALAASLAPGDLMTAATALAHDAFLVTNDSSAFRYIPNLRLIPLTDVRPR